VILDTSAVVALLLKEPEAPQFAELLQNADSIAIAAPTLLECEMVVTALLGAEGLLRLDEFMRALGAEILPFGERELAVARVAFRTYGKGRHIAGLNFGDCFSYATAITRDEALLFKVGAFSQTDVLTATG